MSSRFMPPKVGSSAFTIWTNFQDLFHQFQYQIHLYLQKDFEKYSFALHHRFAGSRANISQTEYSSSVADYCNEVAFGSVFIHIIGVCCNFAMVLQRRVSMQAKGLFVFFASLVGITSIFPGLPFWSDILMPVVSSSLAIIFQLSVYAGFLEKLNMQFTK